jgi:hypothetical protein
MSNRRVMLSVLSAACLALCLVVVALLWPGPRLGAESAAPTSWTWTAGPTLNQLRYHHTATLLQDGRVVVIGGISDVNNATRLNTAEVYDPVTNSWTLYPNGSNSFRNQHTATLLQDGRILVIGGDANFGGVVNSAEIFDPVAGTVDGGGLSWPHGAAYRRASARRIGAGLRRLLRLHRQFARLPPPRHAL